MAKTKLPAFKKGGSQKNKKKAIEKRQPRGGGFGFNKSRELKEILGATPSSSSPVRSTTTSRLEHDGEEEVYVVSSGSILDEKPRLARFKQLSSILPLTRSATPHIMELLEQEEKQSKEDPGFFYDSAPATVYSTPKETEEEEEEEVGFFMDSTPSSTVAEERAFSYQLPPTIPQQPTINYADSLTYQLPMPQQTKKQQQTVYQQQKQKIIQDDSVYISDGDDDNISISSSEDISMLQALSHWNDNNAILFEDTPTKSNKITSDDEDYALLDGTALDDICITSDEELDEDEQEDSILWDDNELLDLNQFDQLPEFMRNSYRGIVAQAKSKIKKQAKNQRKSTERRKKMNKLSKSEKPRQDKNSLLDQILYDFIEKKDVESYRLGNLSYHGRNRIVPKLAKLFQLDISENNKNILLTKTSKTCIPDSYKEHVKKSTPKRKIVTTTTTKTSTRVMTRLDRRAIRDDKLHGKLVASESEPISSNNVGHRMLAAMGWKKGDAIGNRQDGIKEPIQVTMRANRRGLGA